MILVVAVRSDLSPAHTGHGHDFPSGQIDQYQRYCMPITDDMMQLNFVNKINGLSFVTPRLLVKKHSIRDVVQYDFSTQIKVSVTYYLKC